MAEAAHSLREVFAILNRMVREEVVHGYAVVGAIAVLFYAEPARTYDLDVAVALPQSGGVFSLAPVYEWLAALGFVPEGEHVMIFGVPVQFLPGRTVGRNRARGASPRLRRRGRVRGNS